MRVPLINGDYQTKSVIASAQRCCNLYGERNPKDSLVPFTFYNAPGLTSLNMPPTAGAGRGLYWGNNGSLYGVVGRWLYLIGPPPTWTFTPLGTISYGTSIVSMADNGTNMVLVDGTPNGYEINLATNSFTPISAANNAPPAPQVYGFYGADRADMLDGFMLLNYPGTQSFYSTYDNEIVFDASYFAEKNGYSDNLVSVIVTRREIWLIGQRTTEIWFDAGAANFPFQIMPGPFVQHGCSAVYSVAQIDGAVFWLSQDQAGNNILLRGEGYLAKEISNPALTTEWSTYPTTADAVGFCFQQGAHSFYQITFPTADKTWRWDSSTELWHEAIWTDSQGYEHRHRASCAAFAYGVNVCLDWETGQLYQFDPYNHTDNGAPMYFRRGFPHIMNDGKRVIYPGFTLDVEAGTGPNTQAFPGPFPLLDGPGTSANGAPSVDAGILPSGLLAGPAPVDTAPKVLLRWSDTRGRTWGQPVPQTLGATGQYLAQPHWARTGMGRDRVFEVYGVIPGRLAINGAFLEPSPIPMAS